MRNYFTIDGVDSRDYGVYISGQGTFKAPARDYNLIPVPGRNGDLVGPEKRFLNGTLVYPAFIYSNFDANIKAFRNFLLSLVGYHDLVDSYHPDEIRKVLFQGPFEPEVESKNDAGRFDLEFICKPQRFLASGNEVTTFESAGVQETFSGSVVTFDNPGGATVSAISTAINPVQDLHGYSNPWPPGGGKNKTPTQTVQLTTNTYSTLTVDDDGTESRDWVLSLDVSNVNVTTASAAWFRFFDGGTSTDKLPTSFREVGSNTYWNNLSKPYTGHLYITYTGRLSSIRCFYESASYGEWSGGDITNIQLEIGTAPSSFSPYSNICPISGYSESNIVVSPTLDAQDGTTYTASWQTEAGTVYGGTLDVLTGTLTVDRAMVDLGTLTWTKIATPNSHWRFWAYGNGFKQNTSLICSQYKQITANQQYLGEGGIATQASGSNQLVMVSDEQYSDAATFKTAMNGVQLVYELATPLTYQLTLPQIQTLAGANNIWSDTGDITATIAFPQDQFTITNPTLFDSQPLMRVYGTGALGVGSQTVTITQADVYTDIDCEMMDAFKGTANKNPYVQLTDHNFPVFKPGVNNISLGTGITKVEITPRWWIV